MKGLLEKKSETLESPESKANSRHNKLFPKKFYFLFNWGSKTFPLFRVQNVLRQDNELGRVYGWDNSLALMPYRMWLCVGHAQQHIVLSMLKESPTTAEKVWKWYCLHFLTCLTTYSSCTALYSWYPAYSIDFWDIWLKREKPYSIWFTPSCYVDIAHSRTVSLCWRIISKLTSFQRESSGP